MEFSNRRGRRATSICPQHVSSAPALLEMQLPALSGPKWWQFGRGAVPPAKGVIFSCVPILSSSGSPPPHHLSGRKQSGFLLTGSIALLAMKKTLHIFTYFTQLYYHFLTHLLFPKFIRNENERCSPEKNQKEQPGVEKKHVFFLFLDSVFNSQSTRRKTRRIIYQFSWCSTRVVFPSLRGGALNQYVWNPSTPDNSAPNVSLSTGKKVCWGFMSCAVSCQICKTWYAFWFY